MTFILTKKGNGMRIIGPPSATQSTVAARIESRAGVHPRFMADMFSPLWDAAVHYFIDPVGVVAQSAKETGWGNFGGNVRPEFRNTCGLKIRADQQALFPGVTNGDNPLAHSMFASWDVGARAQVQHLRIYAGWPVEDFVFDPRYYLVSPTLRLENFEELGGRWAPSPQYGVELVDLARTLQ